MKKSILLLGGVGIGVGLAYALKSHRDDRSNARQVEGNGDKAEQPETSAAQNKGGAEESAELAGAENYSTEKSVQPAAASMKKLGDESTDIANESQIEIDDRGTDQQEASEILKTVRDAAFDGSDEKLALALGRPIEEIEAWSAGSDVIDGDVVMKARALANERGVGI
jgi:hypothetical protein